jgi:transketolase
MSAEEKSLSLSHNEIKKLQKDLRLQILDLHYKANAGHIGCSLSCIDLMIASLICHKAKDDTFILSKGHAATALYSCLNYLGEITDNELNTFYKNGTTLSAHPAANKFPGIPFATGSLGHGFPVGAGIVKAAQMKKQGGCVYVLLSDGETNEGTTWEAAHFSRQHKLDKLIILVDKNKIQGFGNTEDVLGNTSTREMWESLGFDVSEANGHEVESVIEKMNAFKNSNNGKPKVIIADTVKGKGVSYMENQIDWHYWPMNEDQYKKAVEEIENNYK